MAHSNNSCSRLGLSIALAAMLVLIVTAVIFVVVIELEQPREKPNIVFVLVDDLGFNDVSWNNDKGEVYMPTMDRMAKAGNILSYNYMQPACSPSRGVIMTGRYAHHIGMQHTVIRPEDPQCAPPKEKFMSEALKELGYATHLIGKWHLGFCSWNCTALNRGFDTSYGFFNGFIDYFDKTIFGGYDWRLNNEIEVNTNGIYATDLITTRAVSLIEEQDIKQPLFLYVAHGAPHIPIQAPKKYIDLVSNVTDGPRKTYLAMVASIDASIAAIEKALIEKDMMKDTILIVTSDNGGEAFTGASNYPLRGAKSSLYEGGTRSPAFVYSPLMKTTGVVSEDMIHASDWYPTVLEMATGKPDKDIDGVNQYNMIMKNGKGNRHEMIYNLDVIERPILGRGAIRVGDFKLILGYPGTFDGWEADGNLNETYFTDLLSGGTWNEVSTHKKAYRYDYDFPYMSRYADHVANVIQLYNLKLDPEERNNVATLHPSRVEAMLKKLKLAEQNVYPINRTLVDAHPDAHHRFYDNVWTPGWC